MVAQDGEIVLEHYFHEASPDDVYETDSAAKTVMACLIGILVTDGKLDLDRPLQEYNVSPTTFWGARNLYWPEITARLLLSQVSGMGTIPPARDLTYSSGEHIQELSYLIGKLTSPPYGRWSTPVHWAEEVFSTPLGIQGLFKHDDLYGDISIGGGQMVSCRVLAKVGQLMLNRGKWPSAPGGRLYSEEYAAQMTTPSFPSAVSTYGFLTWLNRRPIEGDSHCCTPAWGNENFCRESFALPILGVNLTEEMWLALGFLSRYLIVLPERQAFIVSLGMDMAASVHCPMGPGTMAWDDAYGVRLHYHTLKAYLPLRPEGGQAASTSPETAAHPSHPGSPSVEHLHGHHHHGRRRRQHHRRKGQGGSCRCTCPVGEAFGSCFDLPSWATPNCSSFELGYEVAAASDWAGGCPALGLAQQCTEAFAELGSGACARLQWAAAQGLACEAAGAWCPAVKANASNSTERPVGELRGPDGLLVATCSCTVHRWTCSHSKHSCDPEDPYFNAAPHKVMKEILWQWPVPSRKEWYRWSLSMRRHTVLRMGYVALLAAALICLALFLRSRRAHARELYSGYRPL